MITLVEKIMLNMKPYKSNFLNSIVLIFVGAWGAYPYMFLGGDGSPTSLIPIFFGIILLVFNSGIKKENKIISHIVVLLTLVIFVSLLMPLKGAIGRSDSTAILRVSLMLISSLLAIITFIKSFIDARR